MTMELVKGAVVELAHRVEIGAGLTLAQSADGIPVLDTATVGGSYVLKAGDTMTGPLVGTDITAGAKLTGNRMIAPVGVDLWAT